MEAGDLEADERDRIYSLKSENKQVWRLKKTFQGMVG